MSFMEVEKKDENQRVSSRRGNLVYWGRQKKKMVTERKISVLVSEARIANLETLTRENLFKVNLFSSWKKNSDKPKIFKGVTFD